MATKKNQVVQVREDVAIASVPVAVLSELAFVPMFGTVDPDSPAPGKHGYQREPVTSRARAIGRYYIDGGVITPLVMSVRHVSDDERDNFLAMLSRGELEQIVARWGEHPLAVIDGQHRKLGLEWALEETGGEFNPMVPVSLIFGLSYEEEAEMFDKINTTQQGVGRALVEITRHDITQPGTETYQQKIRHIAAALARDEDSVWSMGRISFSGRSSRGQTTFEGLRRSTASMFPEEFLERFDDIDHAVELAKAYWAEVAEASEAAWEERPRALPDGKLERVKYRIHDLVGVAALAKLGKDVISSALDAADEDRSPADTIHELVQKLETVDWEKRPENPMMAASSGFSGQRDLYIQLYRVVYGDVGRRRRAA